jgi:hypothetical protein
LIHQFLSLVRRDVLLISLRRKYVMQSLVKGLVRMLKKMLERCGLWKELEHVIGI